MSSSASRNQGIAILASFEDRAIPLNTPSAEAPSGKGFVIGDWMGSTYDVSGRRCEFCFFFDQDGRYERTVRREPDFELRDSGKWEYHQAENLLQMEPETPDESNKEHCGWRVLSVNDCEESNVVLVLREAILASRNLPILFYRVHDKGRGYGPGWTKNLIATSPDSTLPEATPAT